MLAKGWKPTQLSGCVLWLNADMVSGSDGDAIATWANQAPTGSANDAVQATGAKQPLLKKAGNGMNGHNVLRFDGTNDYMRVDIDPGATGLTFFYVAKVGATFSGFGYGCVMGSGGVDPAWDSYTAGLRWAQACGNATDGFGAGWAGASADVVIGNVGGIENNKPYIASYRYDKVNWTMTGVNAVVVADTTFPANPYKLHIGAEGVLATAGQLPFDGDIAEVLVFNRALTDAETFAVNWYLHNKYIGTVLPLGAKLWLDADTVAGSDGDAVSSWEDQTAYGNDFAQATGGNQPIVKTNQLNGHRCVRFADNSKFMSSSYAPTIGTAKTVALVCKLGSLISTGYTYPFTFLNGTTHDILLFFHERNAWYPWTFRFQANTNVGSPGFGAISTGGNTTAAQKILISYDGTTPSNAVPAYLARFAGVNQSLANAAPSLHAGLGEASSIIGGDGSASDPIYMALDIFELIWWERQLSEREMILVESYLNTKYGL